MVWVYTRAGAPVPRQPRATIPRERFEELYTGSGRTLAGISSESGVPTATLYRWMKKWGVAAVRHFEFFLENTFGHWVVLSETQGGSRGTPTLCRCRCVCGTESLIPRGNLQQGLTRSCGCLQRLEPGADRGRIHPVGGASPDSHGLDLQQVAEDLGVLIERHDLVVNETPLILRATREDEILLWPSRRAVLVEARRRMHIGHAQGHVL